MRKNMLRWIAACLVLGTVTQLYAADKTVVPELKVGDMAPDFKMQYFDGSDLKDMTLSQYRGKKNIVLAFYIFAFTGG